VALRIEPGSAHPLGATPGGGVNFALFSAHAERVELCLFEPGAPAESARVTLPGRTGDIWHGFVPGLAVGQHYGYRVHGPQEPHRGHYFDPYKLLVDPYARELSGPVDWPAWGEEVAGGDRHDSAPGTPRGVVVDDGTFDWTGDTRPGTSWPNTIIYEVHVGGYTRLRPDVPAQARGTFEGLAHPHVVEHLLRLGVTAVELMPVHAFVDDAFLVRRGLRNFWGYSTLGFFAPETRYLGERGRDGFKAMVRTLHQAGIEVILDVVYNHTCEGNHLGPTLSFRGIDNASYYRLAHGNPARYRDETGCGNTLDVSHPQVLALVLDSLRYWAEVMHVDGFRFDLATALARGVNGFEAQGRFFSALAADPLLSKLKLIAEPWDVGPEGYRLGGFPPGWAEWNDRYRDTVRRFWLQPGNPLPEFARRVHGSGDLFDHPGRGPWASVNYVASHDGFTLRDLVSYEQRHNEANGEDNRDGHSDNHANNHGVEGPTDDPHINALRARQARNLVATVLLSQGTPMLLAGDEMGRTQDGNNNAYCQDNEIGWVDWSRLAEEDELIDLVARLCRIRAEHPVLRQGGFVHGESLGPVTGLRDIDWLRPDGQRMNDDDWNAPDARCLGMLLSAPVASSAVPGAAAGEDVLLIVFNAAAHVLSFAPPRSARFAAVFSGWRCLLSTGAACLVTDAAVVVPERSVCVFEPVMGHTRT